MRDLRSREEAKELAGMVWVWVGDGLAAVRNVGGGLQKEILKGKIT